MRILLISSIFPPDIGGPATYVPQVAKGLVKRGHEVRVLTTSEPEHLAHDDSRYPFPVFRMNRRVVFWCRPFYYIRHILRQGHNPDVIYANGVFLETAAANLWLHKPLVMKVVGDEAWERAIRRGWTEDSFESFQVRRQRWPAEALKRLRSWALRLADLVIVPSKYLKRFVAAWGVPEKRCMVIYNAVHDNATEGTTQAKELVSLPESLRGRVRLITVGRLVAWKGVDLIIKALSELPQACLTVVGDGPCREEWESLATKEGVAGRLWFTGAVSRAPLRMLLRVHHIFVLASSYEGLPHIVLEAMHAGLPVVATAVGGTPEIVRDGENGLLVSSRDKGSLAKALRELVTSRDLRARLRREASVTLASFSFTHMLLETEHTLAGVAWKRADGS